MTQVLFVLLAVVAVAAVLLLWGRASWHRYISNLFTEVETAASTTVNESTPLYRCVEQAELESIELTKRFLSYGVENPTGEPGKFFWGTLQEAQAFQTSYFYKFGEVSTEIVKSKRYIISFAETVKEPNKGLEPHILQRTSKNRESFCIYRTLLGMILKKVPF